MPSFLSPAGSNRLRKTRNTREPVVETTKTATAARGSGSGASGSGVGAGDTPSTSDSRRRSFVSFARRDSTSSSVSNPKLQRSESWKRRFNLNILSRGKNRLSTEQQQHGNEQGNVSSRIGDVRHQSTGSAETGELGTRSKDRDPLPSSAQQTSALGVVAQRSSKLSKARPIPSTSLSSSSSSRLPVISRTNTKPPSRLVVASKSALLPPVIAPAPLSLPLKSSLQQQQQGKKEMAATTTMTSAMQDPKRSYPLTLTADQPYISPREAQRQRNKASSPPPQRSHHHPSSATPPPPMPNIGNSYSSSSAPKALNQTTNAFSRPSHIEISGPASPRSPADTIDTPLSYYITPSQTPTFPDGFDTPSVPTVMRPGPATPPLTEESGSTSSSTKLMILTDPSASEAGPWQGDHLNVDTPEDRAFNGPPTPASSASSQTNPGKRVNFVEPATTPTGSVHSVRSNGTSGNRFSNYRPAPTRPVSFPRGNGPAQPPMRGPPRGKMPLRPSPPRPPSPIYMNPPNMKGHLWAPLRPTQLNCTSGHTFIPFRNKQHSILCTVCRSMEFEGRGEPVKRSFYCTWCAVRLCGGCKEELVGECGGSLTELWDRTEEKRARNMDMVKEGKMMVKREIASPEGQNTADSNGKSTVSMLDVANQGDRQSATPQEKLSTGDFPFPTQRPLSQGPQLRAPRQNSQTPQPEQSRTPQPQKSRTPPLQSRTPPLQSRTPLSQSRTPPLQSRTPPLQSRTPPLQSRTPPLQSRTPPLQSRTPPLQQSRVPRLQSRTPLPEQSRTPQPREPRIPQPPQQLRSPRPEMNQRPSDREPAPQRPRPTSQVPPATGRPAQQTSNPANKASPSRAPMRTSMSASMPQLTPAETERYKLIPVTSHQKPPSSGTVVLVGEKQKAPSIIAASLKGSLKKKKGWFRGFGKKKDV